MGKLQQTVSQRAFTMINMGYYTKIPDVLHFPESNLKNRPKIIKRAAIKYLITHKLARPNPEEIRKNKGQISG
jgi:hypothetical protein